GGAHHHVRDLLVHGLRPDAGEPARAVPGCADPLVQHRADAGAPGPGAGVRVPACLVYRFGGLSGRLFPAIVLALARIEPDGSSMAMSSSAKIKLGLLGVA